MNDSDALWDWAVAAYAAPGVKEAALALQDQFGAHVPLALWAAYAELQGKTLSLDEARAARAALAALSAQTRALRDARRLAPELAAGLPGDLAEQARAAAGAAELAFERLQFAILAMRSLPSASGAPADNLAAALAAAGLDLNQREAKEAKEALAAALARFTPPARRA